MLLHHSERIKCCEMRRIPASFHIKLRNVIGHNESLTSPYHHERYPAWRCQTHGDWARADMDVYRTRLGKVATAGGVALGRREHRVESPC